MNFDALTQPAVQAYIRENERQDLVKFCLKKSPFPGVSPAEMAQQIAGRRIAEKKFPTLYPAPLLYPAKLNLEQTSSEATAHYKASLVQGKTFCDLTSGFGIDAYFIDENFEEVTLVEQDATLLKMVQHNWEILGRKANYFCEDLHRFLLRISEPFDLIFLDPARRNASKRKVFLLEDLSPNILELQELLGKAARKVMIKLSPLIDLQYLISILPGIVSVHVVALRNEVKEILVLLESNYSGDAEIIAVNLESVDPKVTMRFTERFSTEPKFSGSQKFIFIPNTALLKAGLTNAVAAQYHLNKLHPNTQLLTGNNEILDFPGRMMAVEPLIASQLKKNLTANVIAKNYPLGPEEIRRKYKIKDGGKQYLIFCRSVEGLEILGSV